MSVTRVGLEGGLAVEVVAEVVGVEDFSLDPVTAGEVEMAGVESLAKSDFPITPMRDAVECGTVLEAVVVDARVDVFCVDPTSVENVEKTVVEVANAFDDPIDWSLTPIMDAVQGGAVAELVRKVAVCTVDGVLVDESADKP